MDPMSFSEPKARTAGSEAADRPSTLRVARHSSSSHDVATPRPAALRLMAYALVFAAGAAATFAYQSIAPAPGIKDERVADAAAARRPTVETATCSPVGASQL